MIVSNEFGSLTGMLSSERQVNLSGASIPLEIRFYGR